MRQAIVGASDGTNERGDSTQGSRSFSAAHPIDDCFAVSFKCQSAKRLALVEGNVEENDLARNFLAAKGGEFVEAVDDDEIRGDAFGGSRRTAAGGGEHDALRGLWRPSGISDQ